jgi:hypothetical protein
VVTYVEPLTVVPEKDRRGRATELARQVREKYGEASSVKELTGPDGKVLTLADCGALPDELRKKTCTGLFADVTECRKKAGGQAGGECEKKAVAEYVTQAREDEGGADDDWADEDEGAADKKAGGTAPR